MPKQALRLPALLIFGIYALYSCVIMPLENYIFSDYVLWLTIWGDVIDVVAQLFEVLGIAAIIGCLIYTVFRYGRDGYRPMLLLAGGGLLFKYVATVLVVGLTGGMFYFPEDLYSILISLLIEAALVAFAMLLGHRFITRAQEEERLKQNAARALGHEPEETALYPFKRPLSRSNPLQRTAFRSMIAVLVLRTVSYVIEEIAYTATGATFTAADLPVTLLYWEILILIPCAIGYFLALGCVILPERLAARRADKTDDEADDEASAEEE